MRISNSFLGVKYLESLALTLGWALNMTSGSRLPERASRKGNDHSITTSHLDWRALLLLRADLVFKRNLNLPSAALPGGRLLLPFQMSENVFVRSRLTPMRAPHDSMIRGFAHIERVYKWPVLSTCVWRSAVCQQSVTGSGRRGAKSQLRAVVESPLLDREATNGRHDALPAAQADRDVPVAVARACGHRRQGVEITPQSVRLVRRLEQQRRLALWQSTRLRIS